MSRAQLRQIAKELDVTSFLDCRAYLSELYGRMKAAKATPPSGAGYSWLTFAEDLGFAPSNVIRLVAAGQRTLAPKSARQVATGLDLTRAARRYFLALAGHAAARTPKEREKYFAELLAAKAKHVATDGQEKERLAYFADWLNPVVREALRLEGGVTPRLLAELVYSAPTEARVEGALALLEKLGLAARDAERADAWKAGDAAPVVLQLVKSSEIAARRFHQAMLELARDAVATVPAARREFDALTLNLSEASFKALKRKIRAFCAEIMALEAEAQPRDSVVQLNIQCFTVTKPIRETNPAKVGRGTT
jgi:uncharacterized protein (TIGR02147 family)